MLDKIEYRAVIRFLHLQGKSPLTIFKEMSAVYGEECPTFYTIKRWKKEFRSGRTSLYDDPREGRPTTATEPVVVAKIEKLILEDRRVTVNFLVREVNISRGSVHKILHDMMHMCKVATRWVPSTLTPSQKQQRVVCAQNILDLYYRDEDFLNQLVTMDECWVYLFDPETNEINKACEQPSIPTPKKAKVQHSSGKVMLSVFWDHKGVIMTDYLRKGSKKTDEYYKNLLKKLREVIKERREDLVTKGILLLADIASLHRVAQTVTWDCGFESVPHPPYSPDLAPSDFFLFPKMKEHLRAKRFHDDNEVISEVESWFSSKSVDFYKDGIKGLFHRCEKCVAIEGEYVEKEDLVN
jgi:Transposase.